MVRGKRLITHPSQVSSETGRIRLKKLPKLPEIIDLAKHDDRYLDYLERAKKRRI